MPNAHLNQAGKIPRVTGKRPSDKAGTSGYCQSDRVYRCYCSFRCGLGDKTGVTGRRCLPFSKAVDLVIVHQIGDVVVTAHGVDKVVSPLSVAIAITADPNNYKLRVRYFSPNRDGKRPAMKTIKYITSGIMG